MGMIPDEAVEAAAKVMKEKYSPYSYPLPSYMAEARAILEAAAPHMLKSAYDLGFQHGSNEPANPYRTTK